MGTSCAATSRRSTSNSETAQPRTRFSNADIFHKDGDNMGSVELNH